MRFILTFLTMCIGLFMSAYSYAATTPPDFTTLTDGIDFSTAITAVLAGFLLLAGFGLAIKGGRVVLRSLGLLPR